MNVNIYTVQRIQQQITNNIRLAYNHRYVTTTLKSDKRGYIALLYSGTARSFSANFETHIVNLMAGCPYTVHLFFHTYTNEHRPSEHTNNSYNANHLSLNSTLAYFEGYTNLDNERVLFRDAVKANMFEYMPLTTLRKIYRDTYDISIKRFTGHPPIPGIYYMWHSQRRSEELRQKYINTTGIVYKWTFRMRHDGVYYTNWWQRAFDVTVYNPSNPGNKNLSHDVSNDWGIRRTRLYDMVYEPRLQTNNVLYVPSGWSNGGYNDQFAAMSSMNANRYFMRILHMRRMLHDEIIHPETSIHLIARWNHMNVDNVSATICYDVVRISANQQQNIDDTSQKTQSCSYKKSGEEDCKILCPKLEKINKALRNSFYHDKPFLKQNATINIKQIQKLLIHHLSHINDNTTQFDHRSSSFYYFYRYITSTTVNDPCLINTWNNDQSNHYHTYYLPFILRSSDSTIITLYNKLLACGASVNTTI